MYYYEISLKKHHYLVNTFSIAKFILSGMFNLSETSNRSCILTLYRKLLFFSQSKEHCSRHVTSNYFILFDKTSTSYKCLESKETLLTEPPLNPENIFYLRFTCHAISTSNFNFHASILFQFEETLQILQKSASKFKDRPSRTCHILRELHN